MKGQPMTFWDALFLLFIALKLTGRVDWSWWVVWSPVWGMLAFTGLLALIKYYAS